MLQRDMKPSHVGGQDLGGGPSLLDPGVKRAQDIEEPTRRLRGVASADLREIPVLPEEARLPRDAVDRAAPERRALRAIARRAARPGQRPAPGPELPPTC
ncbi:hypothetical protein WME73_31210 [Sorangium sp. So ce302]|uniref:hypothetical protein n=1 Tax=Sorangium sp. So ce302 TaxID=3133297 RepID=UPI003F5E863C